MILQKTGLLKSLRYLGIFCAITLGFFSIVATSEEDAKDALGVTIPFDGDATIQLEPVTLTKADEVAATAGDPDCPDVTVAGLLDAAVADLVSDVTITGSDIDTITLNSASSNYTVSWEPIEGTPTDISCSLTITGLSEGAPSTALAATALNGVAGSVALTTDELEVINYYLQNRAAQFEYCYACTSTAGITDYTVNLTLNIDVTVEGEY